MSTLVRACDLAARTTAVARGVLHPAQVPGWLVSARRMVADRLARDGVVATGPAFACYTLLEPDRIEVETGFPVATPWPADGAVLASGLPGGPAAIAVHRADLVPVDAAYRRINRWLAERGLTPRGRHWERYPETPDGAGLLIEVVVPYTWTNWLPEPSAPRRHDHRLASIS